MARSDPPMPIGTIGAPVRAERKDAPSIKSSTTAPSRRVPSGKMTRSSPRRNTSSSALERLTVGRLTVDREGPDGEAQFAEPFVLPHLVLGHEEELAFRAEGGEAEVGKGSVHRGQDGGSGRGDVLSPDDPGPEPGPEHGDEDHPLGPVQRSAPRVDLEGLVPPRCFHRTAPTMRIRARRRAWFGHSHDSTSSTTSCTVRPVVSSLCASSASREGDASWVESIRSRRATPSGASSLRRRARSWADAVR